MKAAIVPAIKGKWEIRDIPTPQPRRNQVLIKGKGASFLPPCDSK